MSIDERASVEAPRTVRTRYVLGHVDRGPIFSPDSLSMAFDALLVIVLWWRRARVRVRLRLHVCVHVRVRVRVHVRVRVPAATVATAGAAHDKHGRGCNGAPAGAALRLAHIGICLP